MSLSEQTKKLTEDFISSQSAENQGIIQGAFTTINATDFGANALREGDQAKGFQLPNNKGGMTALADLLTQGPIVISFYRGGWCPYCNLEFKALNDILPTINELGANLVGISPELPDNSMSTAERHQLKFEVLSDVGNAIAREYGVVMDVPASMRPLYLQWGLDVPAANGDDTWELPIPATYVIDGDGQVVFAYVNKNYTERSEPSEIVRALKSI
ncbi:MAG: AhpC/TSA family protein [Candidatus Thiodiazotropha sp. (ex Dulcina madagascariensis)]|nr:AhpC/TSA family protein [Candidatus Thiodiazotropha sp. (ex Dulcina madagascariensis)]